MKRNKYIIGNWKMNGDKSSFKVVNSINKSLQRKRYNSKIVICPPFTVLDFYSRSFKRSKISFGSQDCHHEESGAYTGCVSSKMIKDAGAKYSIIGHSERRQYQNESISEISNKIISALKENLKVIFCIGELDSEINIRTKILRKQLNSLPAKIDTNKIVLAYEPVWAIGTGKTPSLNDINNIHQNIRRIISNKFNPKIGNGISILYGGSVNPKNASDILNLDNVDGALVGGASIKARDFCKIIDSYN